QHSRVPQVARQQQDEADHQADADRDEPGDAVERHASLFCSTPLPPALTPALAVDYVRELSADVREVLVFGADGELLAGPAATAPATTAARALLDAAGDAAEVEAVTREGVVCVV